VYCVCMYISTFMHKRCSYLFFMLPNLHIGRCKIIFLLLALL
jgi:hypothetical protein